MKTGKQVQAVIKDRNRQAVQEAMFKKVGLAETSSDLYPFELSGGMARRVLAVTAMVSDAKLIIADEPTPGLDPDSLSETINYLKQLANDGKGIMLITHDIESALRVADKVAVFYAGQTVEITNADHFSGKGEKLRHPYSRALWNALPQNDFIPIKGSQPFAYEVPKGCAFQPRCPIATEMCAQKQPKSQVVEGGMVRCGHA